MATGITPSGDDLQHYLVATSSTDLSPYTLMFGRKPVLPVDQLINNTRVDWSKNYVREQSKLIRQAQSIAKECLMKAADADKQTWDRRAHAGPFHVGCRVLLKQCAFTGTHKLSYHYGEATYVIVRSDTDKNLCEIRLVNGGPAKWVIRKLLIQDHRSGSQDPPVGLDIMLVVGPSLSEVVEPSESEIRSPGAEQHPVVVFRRSKRINKRHAPLKPCTFAQVWIGRLSFNSRCTCK